VTFTVNVLTTGPTLTSVTPNTGTQGVSVPVTLTGTNFVSGAAVNVSGSGVTVSNVSVVSATQVTATFTVASNATLGTRNVTVTTAGSTSNPVTFTINPPAGPTITSISPNSGTQGVSVPVTLTGTNFVSGAAVNVSGSGVTVSNVSVVSTTQLTATFTIASNATLGARNVTVTTSAGTSGAVTFTVNVLTAAPTLSSISPSSGTQGATVPVTLTGTDFVSGAAVNVSGSGVTVSNVSAVSTTQLTATFTIASNASAGTVNVTVTTPAGTSGSVPFGINAPAPPVIASLGPTSVIAGGTSFTLTVIGTGFAPSAVVQWNGSSLTTTFVNATQLTAAVPANLVLSPGTVSITVNLQGVTSAGASFTVVPGINLTGLLPTAFPTEQTNVGVALGNSTNIQLDGTLELTFQSDANNTPTDYPGDPTMLFSTGGTSIDFTIPVGASTATFHDAKGNIMSDGIAQGTVAGTITVTMTKLVSGGTSVLPEPRPSNTVSVALHVPVIKSGTVHVKSVASNQFIVELDAYSTPRDLQGEATFTFQASNGTELSGQATWPVNLDSQGDVTKWFTGAGLSSGGAFHLEIPFSYSGDPSVMQSATVTVTLSNSVGPSSQESGGWSSQ
jgi:hypothetical protein